MPDSEFPRNEEHPHDLRSTRENQQCFPLAVALAFRRSRGETKRFSNVHRGDFYDYAYAIVS